MTTQVLPIAQDSIISNTKAPLQEGKQSFSPLTRDQLVERVALVIEDMITDNSTRYTSVEEVPHVTPFHAKKLASISIKDYIKRFATHSNCHDNVFVLALIYLDRVGEEVLDFNLDTLNVLRLLLISMTLACKSHDDYYYKNSYYAKIGGVTLEEFNALELKYLENYIKWSLYVDSETYEAYYQDLVLYHQDQSTDKEVL